MSEYETIQAINLFADNASGIFMDYVAIFSAYLIAAYFIVYRLTRFQFWLMNFAYVAASLLSITAEYSAIGNLRIALGHYLQMEREMPLYSNPLSAGVVLLAPIPVMLMMFAGSLIFVHSARKRNQGVPVETNIPGKSLLLGEVGSADRAGK